MVQVSQVYDRKGMREERKLWMFLLLRKPLLVSVHFVRFLEVFF